MTDPRIEDVLAEIERLTAVVEQRQALIGHQSVEIERLKVQWEAAKREAEAEVKQLQFKIKHLQDELEDEHAEVVRLQVHSKSMIDALNADIDAKANETERLLIERDERFKLLQERNDEVARLRGENTRLLSENERLKAERYTVKRMLEDLLNRHGPSASATP